MSLIGSPLVREQALFTRMFERDVLPWECGEHDPVDVAGLGRVWKTCRRCGFLLEQVDRELLLRLAGRNG